MKMDSALLTSHKSGKKTETLEWSSVSQQLSDDGKNPHPHLTANTISSVKSPVNTGTFN